MPLVELAMLLISQHHVLISLTLHLPSCSMTIHSPMAMRRCGELTVEQSLSNAVKSESTADNLEMDFTRIVD